MMRELTPALAMVVLALLVILVVAWVALSVWEECRSFGHSLLYCLRMVGR